MRQIVPYCQAILPIEQRLVAKICQLYSSFITLGQRPLKSGENKVANQAPCTMSLS
jgi:hypothetical protein